MEIHTRNSAFGNSIAPKKSKEDNNFTSAESFKKGCCQLQAKVCARSTGELLVQACPGKSVVR